MRLVKLVDTELEVDGGIEAFFLSMAGRAGLFQMPKGKIGRDELHAGEPLLFSLKGEIRYVALASSGRNLNAEGDTERYPFCFTIDPRSIRKVSFSMDRLQTLVDETGLRLSIQGQGWTVIPDTPATKAMFDKIVAEGSPL